MTNEELVAALLNYDNRLPVRIETDYGEQYPAVFAWYSSPTVYAEEAPCAITLVPWGRIEEFAEANPAARRIA